MIVSICVMVMLWSFWLWWMINVWESICKTRTHRNFSYAKRKMVHSNVLLITKRLWVFLFWRFTLVLMERCPKATKNSYMKTQPPYPHQLTRRIAKTLMQLPFMMGGWKRNVGGAYLHFIFSPKEVKTSACCLLKITHFN